MRHFVKPLLLTAAVVTMFAGTNAAVAQDYKYCAASRENGPTGNCSFSTLQQCQATASGTDAICDINPRWAFAHQRQYNGRQGQPYSSY